MKTKGPEKGSGRFILMSLLFLVLFTAGYWVVVSVRPPTWKPVQTQWETNVVTVQDFLYREQVPQSLVIGSSMSRRIQAEYLPKEYYNLSCLGGKVFSLMEIIRRSGKYPKVLLVEANSISIADDPELVEHVFHPMLGPAREKLPILQDRYKPFSLVFGPAMNAGARVITGKNIEKAGLPTSAGNKAYREMVGDVNRRLGEPLPQTTIDLEWKELKYYLKDFEEHGTKVVFYFIPMNPWACLSMVLQQKIALLANHQSEYGYKVIPMPDCTEYQTSDGTHLEQPSARKFARYLLSNIE